MNSLRARLTVWFGLVFLAIVVLFTFLTRYTLEDELRKKNWEKDYPDHPDWKLHGSYSEEEVDDISGELVESALVWSVPLVIAALVGGYWMAHQSLRPIAKVNEQLAAKNSENLGKQIQLPEADNEFRELLRQLNDLLSRLDKSFAEMNQYAAKVAHELRTPLTILRLKIEQAGDSLSPGLAEDLEHELYRLSYVVDQSLLIARAGRRRIPVRRVTFNFSDTVRELIHDFQLLADEQKRSFLLLPTPALWVKTDPHHIRQIIQNLLSNMLRHGEGVGVVRVKQHGGAVCLLLLNRIRQQKGGVDQEALGLGLRVVDALLRLDSGLRCRRRRGKEWYCVRLKILAAEIPLSSATPAEK